MSNAKRAKAGAPNLTPFTPIVIDTSAPAVDDERMVVFSIDGVEHTIPKRLPAADTIRALEVLATQGQVAAAWSMVQMALSAESLEALMGCRQVTFEQVQSIFDQIAKLYVGQVQDLAGK